MPRFELTVRSRFEAAHHLTRYRGRPEAVHGHSWLVEARLEAETLNDEDYVFDFVELRRHLDELTGQLNHSDVNTVPPFDRQSPTTENLARWFYEELVERCREAPVVGVTVWEGPDCSATYRA